MRKQKCLYFITQALGQIWWFLDVGFPNSQISGLGYFFQFVLDCASTIPCKTGYTQQCLQTLEADISGFGILFLIGRSRTFTHKCVSITLKFRYFIISFLYIFYLFQVSDGFRICPSIYLFIYLLTVLWLTCPMQTLSCSMWELIPWLGIRPRPPALGTWSVSHWTTKSP